jgi:hypothetical protein
VSLVLRPYRAADREAVRRICLETAFRYEGSGFMFEDGQLFADYWTEYYLRFERDMCLVLEDGRGRVVGYLLGCGDSARMFRRMKTRIIPVIVIKLLFRLVTLRYRKRMTYRYIRWVFFRSWREVPPIPLDRFPAHYHLNILREAAFQGGFSRLLLSFLDMLEERGIRGIYGIVLEPGSGGFFTRLLKRIKPIVGEEQEYFWEGKSSLYQYVRGDRRPMVNRVHASSVRSYRKVVLYIAERFGY